VRYHGNNISLDERKNEWKDGQPKNMSLPTLSSVQGIKRTERTNRIKTVLSM